MVLIKIVAATVICVVLCVILRQFKPDLLPLAVIGCVVCFIIMIWDTAEKILEELKSVMSQSAIIDDVYTDILLKVLLIAVLSKFAADFCRDNGFGVLATNVELIGKVIMLSFSFPVIRVICELVQGLLV